MKNKITFLFLMMIMFATPSSAQNIWLKAMNGFNDLTESVIKVFYTWKGVDSSINKSKAKDMSSELLKDVDNLILTKQTIVGKLKTSSTENLNLKTYIVSLQKNIESILTTLNKYDDLITKAGVNSQNLKYALSQDFLQKAETLEFAKGLFEQNLSNNQIRESLIIYFTSCINILKTTRTSLANFKP
jgi:hypothetical protein